MNDNLTGYRSQPADFTEEEEMLRQQERIMEDISRQSGMSIDDLSGRMLWIASEARDFLEGVSDPRSAARIGKLLYSGLLDTGPQLLQLIAEKGTLHDDEVHAATNLYLGSMEVLRRWQDIIARGDEIEKRLQES